MSRTVKLFILIFGLNSLGCNTSSTKNTHEKDLVYEGMSSKELEETLGRPDEIDSSAELYDVNRNQRMKLMKWKYEKRTVLIINDTVKDPQLELPTP